MRVSHPGFRIPTVAAACLLGAALVAIIPSSTQTAIANGDTRVINLHHAHTQESISVAFRVNGSYDAAALKKLNWFLRDWRNDASKPPDAEARLRKGLSEDSVFGDSLMARWRPD